MFANAQSGVAKERNAGVFLPLPQRGILRGAESTSGWQRWLPERSLCSPFTPGLSS